MAPTSATDYTLPDDDARLYAMLAMRPMLQRLPGIRLADTPAALRPAAWSTAAPGLLGRHPVF